MTEQLLQPGLWRQSASGAAGRAAQPDDPLVADDVLAQRARQDAALRGEAFAVLYRRHVTRVYRYLLVRVRDEQDAQDLTAQTFLAALEGLPGYQPHGKFAAWLLGIARRKAADHFRGKTPLPLDAALDVAHPGPPPEETATYHLKLARVSAALTGLAPDRAEALTLGLFAGLDVPAIAVAMGRSEAAVRMLLHRAIHDLRGRLAPLPEEDQSYD